MKTLLIADHNNACLDPATRRTLAAAARIGAPVTVLVAGFKADPVAQAAAALPGVAEVLHADDAALERFPAEALGALVARLGKGFTHILAAATGVAKGFMPRVAALLDVAMVSEAVAIESPDTFVRPIYAGNAFATVQSTDAIKIVTIRATAFDAVATAGGSAPVQRIEGAGASSRVTFVGQELSSSTRPDLTAARVVVSGGRGVGSAENFALIEKLADQLNAAVGASRAAVDAGYISNDHQVGQTGKVVAPELYIAVGISGAIQHLAGMKDSKVIVAINKDPDAPIFQVADYGLVADLFQAVPELTTALAKKG